MNFDYDALDHLRRSHSAWRLLRSDHAALVASFLNRVFIAPNERVLAQSDLAEALEDELYAIRERSGADAFPKAALAFESLWGTESSPIDRDLPRLTAGERALYDDLRDNRIGTHLRLEQERIGFAWVRNKLSRL